MPPRRRRHYPSFKQTLSRFPWRRALLWSSVILLSFVAIDACILPSGAEFAEQRPETTALIEERSKESIEQGKNFHLRRVWIPYAQIDTDLIRAVLIAEDAAFADHGGFDRTELWNSLWTSVTTFKRLRGASTITQQLSKNLYLSTDRSILRKWREAIITLKMERMLSKRRILELYLNYIEWGDGVFGAESAARFYFGNSAHNLTSDEAAFLAALIPNPRTTYNPRLNGRRVAARQRIIRKNMELFKLPAALQ